MSEMQRTAPPLSFGPYRNPAEARIYCQRFVEQSFAADDARELGIVWAEQGGSTVLRPPVLDRDQMGSSVLVQWHGPVMPVQPAPPSGGFWQSFEGVVASAYQKLGAGIHQASSQLTKEDTYLRQNFGPAAPLIESESGLGAALAVRDAWRFVKKELDDHPKVADVLSTALDAVGVVTGIIGFIALAPEIATVAGALAVTGAVVATAASGALLIADGIDTLHLVIQDDKAATDNWEKTDFYRRTQLLAPLLALPDAVRGGVGVTREVSEASNAAREAGQDRAFAAAAKEQAASRVADQQAANDAKAKIYKGDRAKLDKLVKAEKNAAKKLRKASDLAGKKAAALRAAILKSLVHDGPALGSTAAGTGIYVGHLPGMMDQYPPSQPPQSNQPSSPAQSLIPPQAADLGNDSTHYFSFGIIASSPLRAPGQK